MEEQDDEEEECWVKNLDLSPFISLWRATREAGQTDMPCLSGVFFGYHGYLQGWPLFFFFSDIFDSPKVLAEVFGEVWLWGSWPKNNGLHRCEVLPRFLWDSVDPALR